MWCVRTPYLYNALHITGPLNYGKGRYGRYG